MVAAPVAAVKSRVVVATANANRVKTSQHSSISGPKQKTQHIVAQVGKVVLFGL